MNERSMSTRGLVVAVIVIALLSLLMPPGDQRASSVNLSSHLVGDDGGRGFYRVIEALGVDVSRWQRPLEERSGRTGTEALALLAPGDELDDAAIDWIFDWVGSGGLLVYVPPEDIDSFGLALGLADAGVARARVWDAPPEDLRTLLEDVPDVTQDFTRAVDVTEHTADDVELIVASDADSVAVARFAIGRGHVLMVASDPEVLATGEIAAHEDSSLLAVRLTLAALEGRALVFDEYHHGYKDGAGMAAMLGGWLLGTPGGWATLALLALTLLALIAAGWRFGRALPVPPPPARSSLEHVDALADAFASSGAVARPAHLLADGLRRRWSLATTQDLERRLESLRSREPTLSDDIDLIERALPSSVARFTDRHDLATLCDAIDRVVVGAPRA